METVLPLNCRCLDPRKVFNPYSKDSLVVPCGHCKACILNKNSRLAFQCDLESASNKYCVFITLTYANRFFLVLILLMPLIVLLDAISMIRKQVSF